MIHIYSNIFPFPGVKATTIWPLLFIRKKQRQYWTERDERHKNIHGEEQKEMLIVGAVLALIAYLFGLGWWSLLFVPIFFWWYGIEWLIRWAYYRDRTTAYKNIAFEREAYSNQNDFVYIEARKPFAWIWYITHYK